MTAIKENQPDKFEKIKRFEKEKKALRKKIEGIDKNNSKLNNKSIQKPKRQNKDWTRFYEDGLMDEYDM
ncbi:hypothetical protein EDC19_0137 [Natranaerovirga hydrolytica]|uniref:Uncharacterized protein n=1 Tax=Natranaerovirga hydrolytica TaxID=680378 RepID=A0A4R1MXC0_9FIRM|nr:hypothetical protein [Natranaerovirga hydrolytica]TCK97735.1 hypothetical protein EDC19_0137 [Natranaerovirga hydrolytica]